MNENLKKLVVALRSGEFKQGRRRLCQVVDGKELRCCLGVALEVFNREHPDNPVLLKLSEAGYYDTPNESSIIGTVLPKRVAEWYGFPAGWGSLKERVGRSFCLWSLNDVELYSFDQIADVIEQGNVELSQQS